ncbi:hypothetical protein [Desulfovibrio fairfieldensis]|nr:hypothetical protein [Desulfovibrio fairfieldensis]
MNSLERRVTKLEGQGAMQKNSTEMSGTVQAFLNIIRERCGQPPEYDPRDSAGIDTFGEMGRRLIDKGVTPAVALHLEKLQAGLHA